MRQALLRNVPGDRRLVTWLLASGAVFIAIFIILYPKQAYTASLQGLQVWWDIVFPALLPFLIASEILTAFGFLRFLGVLSEPAMRFIFRLPGGGGWAICMGAAAGYAASAKTVGHMRKMGWVSKSEGDRLLALSYMCSPVFIIAVVAVGFFQNERLGWLLVIVHFTSWFITGILFSLLCRKPQPSADASERMPLTPRPWIASAFAAMRDARRQDGRGFGKLLGDAVTDSVQALLMIGGYMMLFSVILNILSVSGATPLFMYAAESLLSAVRVPLVPEALGGVFELHLGTFAVSSSDVQAVWQTAAVGALLAWGGFSAHAQVKSLVSGTDLSLRLYIGARVLHALLAFGLTIMLWKPMMHLLGSDGHLHPLPAVADGMKAGSAAADSGYALLWGSSLGWAACFLLMLLLLSLMIMRVNRKTFS